MTEIRGIEMPGTSRTPEQEHLFRSMLQTMTTARKPMRKVAYDLQRTGNPRCEDEAMEIHSALDEEDE